MNDVRLQQLLKMAAEAERLEFGERPLRPSSFPLQKNTSRVVRMWGAAAAILFVGVTGLFTLKSSTTKDPVPVADSAPGIPSVNTCDEESTVLLALFRKADGIAGRATMAVRSWDAARGLSDLAEGELLGIAFEHTNDMTPEALPDSVVLLAVSGPSSLIPHSDAEATVLAACLENTPTACGEEVPCYTSAALSCLPPGVTVRGESRIVR
jgi:hypothetical protein